MVPFPEVRTRDSEERTKKKTEARAGRAKRQAVRRTPPSDPNSQSQTHLYKRGKSCLPATNDGVSHQQSCMHGSPRRSSIGHGRLIVGLVLVAVEDKTVAMAATTNEGT